MNTIKQFWQALGLAALLLVSRSGLAIEGQTLGLVLDYPQIETNPVGSCNYDSTAGSLQLNIDSEPFLVFWDNTGTNVGIILDENDFSLGGTLVLTATVNNTGSLVGGTLSIRGLVDDTVAAESFGPSLLEGTIADFGIVDGGTTDVIEFRVTPTGGTMLSRFNTGDDIGINMQLNNSTYTFDAQNPTVSGFSQNWTCDGPKAIVGPTPGVTPVEVCDLALTKTVTPDQIGPFPPVSEDDNDSDSNTDSGSDNNNNGDSDDSDAEWDDGHHGHHRWSKSSHSWYWCTNPYHDDTPPDCGCKGKVSQLVLQYNGAAPATVTVNRTGPFSTNLFPATVLQPGEQFTVNGSSFGPWGFKGTLGVAIEIVIDGGEAVSMHTSCSQPIGPGLVAGDFEVISGTSKKLPMTPLCPIPPTPCAGETVTYTYTVTNNGSALTGVAIDDDKLGVIVDNLALANAETQMFTQEACITETTTNIATATGTLPSGESCASDPAQATVEVLLPPDPTDCQVGEDTDSDSGMDHNGNGDSDDSDDDSGDKDCDNDTGSAPPVEYQACPPRPWKMFKMNKQAWKAAGYKPGQKFDAVFGVNAAGNKSLLKTLKTGGWGGHRKLGRHAVTALLNAGNPNINYFYTKQEVIDIVQNAYTTKDFKWAADMLKQQNKVGGCPLAD